MRVDFLVCGTQKGGTSALDALLRRHPQICMADTKEVHFFDHDPNFIEGVPDYNAYHRHFSNNPDAIIRGESTPIYMYWETAPHRIHEYNPRMKLILLLRNPITRAFSHWNMERLRDADRLSFMEAIRQEEHRCREAAPLQHRIYSYIDRGLYCRQITRLLQHFTRSQLCIIKSEDYWLNTQSTLDKICDFLCVPMLPPGFSPDVFRGHYSNPMSLYEFKYLRSYFEAEIDSLEKLLGWDCRDWLDDANYSDSP
jgi:hypothetical protein